MTDCGVYAIRNIKNGKSYVGSSCRLARRWRDHLNALRRGAHINVKLQRAWVLHGEQAFVFEVLELCPRPELLLVEQTHMDRLDAYRSGYNCRSYTTGKSAEQFTQENYENMSKAAKARKMPKRGPMPEETKEKIRQAKLGKPLTEEHKKKLSDVRQGHEVTQRSIDALVARNKARAGEVRSEEHRQKMSVALQGHICAPGAIAALVAWNKSNSGHGLSEEHKENIRNALVGKTHSDGTKHKMSCGMTRAWAIKRGQVT